MHFLIELALEVVLTFFWEIVCGWLGSWFLYLISFGRWNLPNDSIRACITGVCLLIAVPVLIVWLW